MNTKNDLFATITSYMGGRTAEETFFDDVTTGASNDIQRATEIARDMVTLYGMSDLGPIKYNSGSENVFLGRDYNSPNNVSGQVAFEIDQEVRKIVNTCHTKARQIIGAHKTELERIAAALMEYETLTAEQILKVVKGESIEDDFKTPSPTAPAEIPAAEAEIKPAETNAEDKPAEAAGEDKPSEEPTVKPARKPRAAKKDKAEAKESESKEEKKEPESHE